ncbi:MAG: hypothetical protein EZS28_031356 [Streblomastix strix]|uniref:Uncharacterized protein n=1 Tax=Streblomastix strix TaxID=222440 RepID=A0A5J4URU7_9EUKA|nr:MAG: hypothetical protein EZS28_031356 [Streblomastix strix]
MQETEIIYSNAFANQLGLEDKQYYAFRELAVEFQINNPQLHDSELESGETIQGRMEGLLMNAWGGDGSIIAAAEAFEVQIYVHIPQETVTNNQHILQMLNKSIKS